MHDSEIVMAKFLKLFGGVDNGRPNSEDLKNAEEFALKLKMQEFR
jgi:hypothetical protein